MEDIRSKWVMITGASGGIGMATAKAFAAQGCNLTLICKKNIQALETLKEELTKEQKIECETIQCDLGKSCEVHALFHTCHTPDILINNAAISYIGLLSDMTDEEWAGVMDTNLNSIFFTSREAVKLMIHRHQGKIINVSSVWGNVGASTEVAYSTAKAGVNGFTKALLKASGKYEKETADILPFPTRPIRLYSTMVSAGTGNFLEGEEYEMVEVGDEVPADADFGVKITGDSMEPRFINHQTVWVHQQDSISNGEIGIFCLNDMSYCKKLQDDKDGLFLISLNKKYEPKPVTKHDSFKVFGKVLV